MQRKGDYDLRDVQREPGFSFRAYRIKDGENEILVLQSITENCKLF